MHLLALDTTTRAGSVALVEGTRVIVEDAGDETRSHAERLPAAVLDCLAQGGSRTGDVGCFAVASGPGSFTGLRIGIATIQGLAFVHGKPVVGVSALLALAQLASIDLAPGSRVGAWMDAHRRDVFSALYLVGPVGSDGLASLTELEGPTVGPPLEAVARWSAREPLPQVVCGDGAVLYRSALPPEVAVRPATPLAGLIGRIAAAEHSAGRAVHPAAVQPLYVRRPDAEVAREAARGRV
ncbi:MAG: tRNA (adenosine(37)-N6)-threonylcarbamoyltransferase complex dimerization subunit type 1 TsaB [Vicinamibacterales bacterium]